MLEPSILMFGWEYPPHNSGGLGVACQGICEALTEDGHIVTFVLPKYIELDAGRVPIVFADKAPHAYLTQEEIDIVKSLQNPYLSETEYYRIMQYSRVLGINIDYPVSLIERVDLYESQSYILAKSFSDVDVIHAHDWLAFGAGIAAKKATGKPFVAHIHATEYDRSPSGNINKEIYRREKRGFDFADKIIAVSNFTKKNIIKHYGVDPSKISVVHNGVISKITNTELHTDLIKLKEAGYSIVLSLGRITLQKGIDYFMRMAKIVVDYRPKTFFVVAGSGDMENQIMELGADLGIAKNVLYTGFVRDDTIDMLYKTADIFIMPSVSEPFGIAPLEAMHQGTPVLISKQSGVAEIATHTLKVDFWDIEEMANKVIAVLSYPELGQTLSNEGKTQVETFSWSNVSKKLSNIYKELKK